MNVLPTDNASAGISFVQLPWHPGSKPDNCDYSAFCKNRNGPGPIRHPAQLHGFAQLKRLTYLTSTVAPASSSCFFDFFGFILGHGLPSAVPVRLQPGPWLPSAPDRDAANSLDDGNLVGAKACPGQRQTRSFLRRSSNRHQQPDRPPQTTGACQQNTPNFSSMASIRSTTSITLPSSNMVSRIRLFWKNGHSF